MPVGGARGGGEGGRGSRLRDWDGLQDVPQTTQTRKFETTPRINCRELNDEHFSRFSQDSFFHAKSSFEKHEIYLKYKNTVVPIMLK